jgi:hypothetical protein
VEKKMKKGEDFPCKAKRLALSWGSNENTEHINSRTTPKRNRQLQPSNESLRARHEMARARRTKRSPLDCMAQDAKARLPSPNLHPEKGGGVRSSSTPSHNNHQPHSMSENTIRCITRSHPVPLRLRMWKAVKWFFETLFSGKGTRIGM